MKRKGSNFRTYTIYNFLKFFPKTYLQTKKNMVSYKSTLNMERWSSWFKAPVLKIGVGL